MEIKAFVSNGRFGSTDWMTESTDSRASQLTRVNLSNGEHALDVGHARQRHLVTSPRPVQQRPGLHQYLAEREPPHRRVRGLDAACDGRIHATIWSRSLLEKRIHRR